MQVFGVVKVFTILQYYMLLLIVQTSVTTISCNVSVMNDDGAIRPGLLITKDINPFRRDIHRMKWLGAAWYMLEQTMMD